MTVFDAMRSIADALVATPRKDAQAQALPVTQHLATLACQILRGRRVRVALSDVHDSDGLHDPHNSLTSMATCGSRYVYTALCLNYS